MKHTIKLFLLSIIFVSTAFAQETEPTLEQRLEHLVEKLETKRVEYNIPGMALAVVLDDKVILEHSFGLSNLDEEIAVTSRHSVCNRLSYEIIHVRSCCSTCG